MRNDLNAVQVSGELAQELELRYTGGGTAVLNGRLETQDLYKYEGEWTTSSSYFTFVVWGQQAEQMADAYEQGDVIWVEGELDIDSWEQNGETQYQTIIDVNEFGTISKAGGPDPQPDRGAQPDDQRRTGGRQQSGDSQQQSQQEETFEPDDNLPF
jgi:single-strand DNA-binding protein